MSRPVYSHRSKEAPMDYEWTNRADVKPAWSMKEDPSTPPKKRAFEQVNPATPTMGAPPPPPTFGRNQNIPFLFNPAPFPQEPQGYPWAPPPQFSPSKAFPHPEIHDVDMNDASPAKEEKAVVDSNESEPARPVANGALRRVYNRRRRNYTRSRTRQSSEDHEDSGVGSASEEDDDRVALRPQSTSNHYTLNLPAHPPQVSETPYVLLGYLQFFFNLSLVLLFLYLTIQFILTVQRDVEKRIIEVSQVALQDIALCATQYKANFCGTEYMTSNNIEHCAKLEICMNGDPTTIGRAKVSAEMIAQVINGFVEPISWKTLIFTLTSLAFLTVFINTLLSLYRSRYQPSAAPLQAAASYPIMPNAPYPTHPFGGYLAPGPTSEWSRQKNADSEEMESPARRRRLEGGASAKIK